MRCGRSCQKAKRCSCPASLKRRISSFSSMSSPSPPRTPAASASPSSHGASLSAAAAPAAPSAVDADAGSPRRTVMSASMRSVRISAKRAATSGSPAPISSQSLCLAPSMVNFLSYRRLRNRMSMRMSPAVYARRPDMPLRGERRGSSLSQ